MVKWCLLFSINCFKGNENTNFTYNFQSFFRDNGECLYELLHSKLPSSVDDVYKFQILYNLKKNHIFLNLGVRGPRNTTSHGRRVSRKKYPKYLHGWTYCMSRGTVLLKPNILISTYSNIPKANAKKFWNMLIYRKELTIMVWFPFQKIRFNILRSWQGAIHCDTITMQKPLMYFLIILYVSISKILLIYAIGQMEMCLVTGVNNCSIQ